MIHEAVCEGCGDCVKQSNCMSLHPVATELGQKIRIHQSSCNKDYTCALGDCASFLTVSIAQGTGLRKRALPVLPETAVGGLGVVTINALLATAAAREGLHVVTADQTGLAQKGGAVVSHLLISDRPVAAAARANAASVDLVLGFDLLGAAHADNLKAADADRTVAVLNTSVVQPVYRCHAACRVAPVEATCQSTFSCWALPGRPV